MTPKEKTRNSRFLRVYGISLEDWRNMYEEQNRVCKICKSLPPSQRLSVDHVHVRGFKDMSPEEKRKYIRGLLCFLCNTGLKNFEKTNSGKTNRQRLNGTYEYFQIFKLKGE